MAISRPISITFWFRFTVTVGRRSD